MNNWAVSAFFLLWSFFVLVGCGVKNSMALTGHLIYSSGGKALRMLDLRTLKQKIVYQGSEYLEHVTRRTAESVYISGCDGLREPNCFLRKIDSTNLSACLIRPGRSPTYVEEQKKIFFYESSNESGVWLMVAEEERGDPVRRVAKAPAAKLLPNGLHLELIAPAVQVSADEVVFVGEDQQLWRYQIGQGTLSPTGIRECRPQGWRSRTQQLLCYDWNTWEAYAIDLKTKRRERLPIPERSYGLLYVPSLDLLIYGKTRLYFFVTETSDIFAYSFHSRRQITLQKHAHLASGVWLEPLK